MTSFKNCFFLIIFSILISNSFGINTISKSNFNFAHQLGYLYSTTDNAYFKTKNSWSFKTGFVFYYTKEMPLVINPDWKERSFYQIPFAFEFYPSNNITLQFNTDLIAQYPRHPILHHSIGGNSPRFRTKIKLKSESILFPALALTMGVKFSSAKPYNIYSKTHNYYESNGLAGPGTGTADYLILITASKKYSKFLNFHTRLGLAPVGDPTKAPSQADEVLYGFTLESFINNHISFKNEVAGMKGFIASTSPDLDHYSVYRFLFNYKFKTKTISVNIEKGLTNSSDDFVLGTYIKFDFK